MRLWTDKDDAMPNADGFEVETVRKWDSDETTMPLKLPPRLQWRLTSYVPSVQVPRATLKLPYSGHKDAVNEDFDPFMAALDKVREPRSSSPFKVMPEYSNDHLAESRRWDSIVSVSTPNYGELKGSPYARWVRDQMKAGIIAMDVEKQESSPLEREVGLHEMVKGGKGRRAFKEELAGKGKGKVKGESVDLQSRLKKMKEIFLKSVSFSSCKREVDLKRGILVKKIRIVSKN